MKYYKYFFLTLGIILIDQTVKIMVHYNMYLHEEISILGDIFKLHYTTNPGMAFGWKLGGEYGKFLLTGFRLVAMVAIAWYLIKLAKKDSHPGLLWCIAMILGGAIGNVIDSALYGVLIPGNITGEVPTPWFHGEVIDMFYVDICYCYFPEWIPFFGGQTHALWPIFNIADASIFIGVVVILIMQKKFFKEDKKEEVAAS
jgi:signal peptidase II